MGKNKKTYPMSNKECRIRNFSESFLWLSYPSIFSIPYWILEILLTFNSIKSVLPSNLFHTNTRPLCIPTDYATSSLHDPDEIGVSI